jgi:hypothetical protein
MDYLLIWKARLAATETLEEFDAEVNSVWLELRNWHRCPAIYRASDEIIHRCEKERDHPEPQHWGDWAGIMWTSWVDEKEVGEVANNSYSGQHDKVEPGDRP